MPFQVSGELRYYQFEIFERNLYQGIFTRLGGVSPAPWASLNLGGTVGDESWRVSENRRRVMQALNRNVGSVYDAWQVHGAQVARRVGVEEVPVGVGRHLGHAPHHHRGRELDLLARLDEKVVPREKQETIRRVLTWYRANHPVWFGWLELE